MGSLVMEEKDFRKTGARIRGVWRGSYWGASNLTGEGT